MSLMQQIPKEFYRVFRTKNREHYFAILVELYKANVDSYYAFGLSKSTCRDIISETMVRMEMKKNRNRFRRLISMIAS